ncbi:MAG: hypothetical protein ACK4E7_02025 [Permianibacter sp.]
MEPALENKSSDGDNRTDKRIYRFSLGAVIIVIGLLFLAREHGYKLDFLWIDNWWALFILIPAVAMATRVVTRVRRLGRFDAEAAGTSIGALATGLVAVMLLLDWDFGKWWPLFIVLGGLSIVISGFAKEGDK